ncbi:MAG: membrane protein insertase YidC, partial [Proteobacteria bacterium]|nr:membrane protein insertase YidC [Pseudomonadota bacterium]
MLTEATWHFAESHGAIRGATSATIQFRPRDGRTALPARTITVNMFSDQRNLIIAIVLSLSILLGFEFLYNAPRLQKEAARQQAIEKTQPKAAGETSAPATGRAPTIRQQGDSSTPAIRPQVNATAQRAKQLEQSPRITIESPKLAGTLAIAGGQIDDIVLKAYRESVNPESANITMLSPVGTAHPYYVKFGWTVADESAGKTPSSDTIWKTSSTKLSPATPVTLTWDNGKGLLFERTIELDQDFMFTIKQRVKNNGAGPVTLYPYGFIARVDEPPTLGFFILHEGPLGVFNDRLEEHDYEDIADAKDGRIDVNASGGWIGITDQYWLTALIPNQDEAFSGSFNHSIQDGHDRYQVDYIGGGKTVAPGATVEAVNRLFIGAKEVKVLDKYKDTLGVQSFDKAIDFGWFYFMTKPLFYVIAYFYNLLGNFGLAILLLTVIVKIIFFPLANKSYRALSGMKKLQPEMMRLRDRYKDDRQQLNKE